METILKFIKKHKLILIGIFVGAVGGYMYYYFVGCASGSCPITSRPLNSTLYGAMMGGLLFSMFRKSDTKNTEEMKQKNTEPNEKI